MGLLGKVLEFVLADQISDAVDIPIKALDKATKVLESKSEKGKQKLFDIPPGTGILAFNEHRYMWNETYDVYDENREVKYTIKGEMTSIKRHMHVYDSYGNKLGMVKEKLIAWRLPLTLGANPIDFEIEVNGRSLGKVKSRWALGKQKYEVNYNGWHIEGDLLGAKYKILNGSEEIAQVSLKFFNWGGYVATYPNLQNEIPILMLVLAIEAANAPKRSKKMRHTIHRKSGGWV